MASIARTYISFSVGRASKAPVNLETVMRPIGQIDDDLNRQREGAGLGLPLVKSMTDMCDGSLEIDTALGRGTTVTMTAPPPKRVAESVLQQLNSNFTRG
ncbi:MAG: ATP-binding protein [Alphaproteobacteria bacterium]